MIRIKYIRRPAYARDAYAADHMLARYIGQDHDFEYAFRPDFVGSRKAYVVKVYDIATGNFLRTQVIRGNMGSIPALPTIT